MVDRTPSQTPKVAPGTVISLFSEAEATQLAADWLSVFGRNSRGVNVKAYLWHVFSGARYPSVRGAEALERYRRQVGTEFVVLSNDRRVALVTDRLPESSSLADAYIFPRNLAWTMAFTHEDGWLGPYFAMHPEYAALSAENELRARKAREVEAARQKGWC